MSTSSRIFNEQVFKVDSTSSGKKTFEFQVENDGFILSIDYISGTANVLNVVKDIMPDEMTDLELDRIIIAPSEIDGVKRYAYIAGRRASVTVVWEGATNLIFSVRAVSAEAIRTFNNNDSAVLSDNNLLLESLVTAMESGNEINKKILNHLRKVTELNDEEAGEF